MLRRIVLSTISAAVPVLMAVSALNAAPKERMLPIGASEELRIIVLEGEDGVNVLKKKTAVSPVVEVRDKNNLPIAGAAVVFLLPRGGSGGEFAAGAKTFTATTDAQGRAVSGMIKPLGKGSFRIRVQVTYQGHTATTSIAQTNFSTAAQALKAGKTPGTSAHASSASQSASASSSGAASGGAGGSSAAAGSAAAATGTSAGGLSAGAVAGIVGGVAAAGAGAGLAVTHKSEEKKDCTSFLNQAVSDLNAEASVCTAANTTLAQCRTAAQKVIDDVGRACACSSTVFPADVRQLILQISRNTGLSLPASCGF